MSDESTKNAENFGLDDDASDDDVDTRAVFRIADKTRDLTTRCARCKRAHLQADRCPHCRYPGEAVRIAATAMPALKSWTLTNLSLHAVMSGTGAWHLMCPDCTRIPAQLSNPAVCFVLTDEQLAYAKGVKARCDRCGEPAS